jgi:RNase_H superfamily
MEGDPYYDIGTGLEYLFGAYTPEGMFYANWGCDRGAMPVSDRLAEKRALEAFIDLVMGRRERYPRMHVYHYASYEKTALQKLSLRHATREDEVDILLREERLVDLYAIVRQAIVVGQPSYSIKKIEEFYGKRGAESQVTAGADSILRFEEWLALRADVTRRDDRILDDLERYNKYDCVSTHGLRQWLLELSAQAALQFAVEIPPYRGKEAEAPKAEPPVPRVEKLARRADPARLRSCRRRSAISANPSLLSRPSHVGVSLARAKAGLLAFSRPLRNVSRRSRCTARRLGKYRQPYGRRRADESEEVAGVRAPLSDATSQSPRR